MTDLHDLLTKNDKKEGKMKGFWLCWVGGTDGGFHYRHYTFEGALIEAERLARLPDNRGKYVYVLEASNRCKVEPCPVKWEAPECA